MPVMWHAGTANDAGAPGRSDRDGGGCEVPVVTPKIAGELEWAAVVGRAEGGAGVHGAVVRGGVAGSGVVRGRGWRWEGRDGGCPGRRWGIERLGVRNRQIVR